MFFLQVCLSTLLKQVSHILRVELCEEVLLTSQLLDPATDLLFLAQVLVILLIELVCEKAILGIVSHSEQLIVK